MKCPKYWTDIWNMKYSAPSKKFVFKIFFEEEKLKDSVYNAH